MLEQIFAQLVAGTGLKEVMDLTKDISVESAGKALLSSNNIARSVSLIQVNRALCESPGLRFISTIAQQFP